MVAVHRRACPQRLPIGFVASGPKRSSMTNRLSHRFFFAFFAFFARRCLFDQMP